MSSGSVPTKGVDELIDMLRGGQMASSPDGGLSPEELLEQIERLKRENETLKARNSAQLRFQVGVKGGISVYGLGRFPVTLYKEQWLRLLAASQDIHDFIRAHEGSLKTKPGS